MAQFADGIARRKTELVAKQALIQQRAGGEVAAMQTEIDALTDLETAIATDPNAERRFLVVRRLTLLEVD